MAVYDHAYPCIVMHGYAWMKMWKKSKSGEMRGHACPCMVIRKSRGEKIKFRWNTINLANLRHFLYLILWNGELHLKIVSNSYLNQYISDKSPNLSFLILTKVSVSEDKSKHHA